MTLPLMVVVDHRQSAAAYYESSKPHIRGLCSKVSPRLPIVNRLPSIIQDSPLRHVLSLIVRYLGTYLKPLDEAPINPMSEGHLFVQLPRSVKADVTQGFAIFPRPSCPTTCSLEPRGCARRKSRDGKEDCQRYSSLVEGQRWMAGRQTHSYIGISSACIPKCW